MEIDEDILEEVLRNTGFKKSRYVFNEWFNGSTVINIYEIARLLHEYNKQTTPFEPIVVEKVSDMEVGDVIRRINICNNYSYTKIIEITPKVVVTTSWGPDEKVEYGEHFRVVCLKSKFLEKHNGLNIIKRED